jgi:uncharacterized protein (TIGR02453 family)
MTPRPVSARFRPELFRFLRELAENNNREWFQRNKPRYEADVLGACLAFLETMAPEVSKINPNLVADPKPVGGSLMRIYRDVRFSRDKSPYRTSMGLHFFHRDSRGHEGGLPGFFLLLAPGQSFVAGGMWMPPAPDLARIRTAIVRGPARWKTATRLGLDDDENALKRVPPGFDPESPLAADLKRKSFTASIELKDSEVTAPTFSGQFLEDCRHLDPLNAFLAKAVGVRY